MWRIEIIATLKLSSPTIKIIATYTENSYPGDHRFTQRSYLTQRPQLQLQMIVTHGYCSYTWISQLNLEINATNRDHSNPILPKCFQNGTSAELRTKPSHGWKHLRPQCTRTRREGGPRTGVRTRAHPSKCTTTTTASTAPAFYPSSSPTAERLSICPVHRQAGNDERRGPAEGQIRAETLRQCG